MRFKTININKKILIFREKLLDWQEKYIEGFIKEYVSFLDDDIGSVSEKFCEQEKQIGVLMKISDFIFKFKSFGMRKDGLCRVRLFVNTQKEIICVLTDIDSMSNAPYLDTVYNTVIQSLNENGYIIDCQTYILHDDYDNSMVVIDEHVNKQRHLSKKQIEALTECDENEFAKKSIDEFSIRMQIEKKRYEINPFINNQYLKTPEYVKRKIEIQENAISKKQLKELIDAGASERELDSLMKKDLSLIAEIYSYPKDEYIVFSEFLLGEKRVDFAIFSGRSTMDVTFIEIKGADFNLKKRGHYDSLNSKIEEANSQIRNHRKYIYDDYKSIREKLHDIRKKAESGNNICNAFLSPKKYLQVDSNKNVNIRFVIIAGRTPENDIEESDLRYQFGRDDRDVELFSWDSWIRRLSRD